MADCTLRPEAASGHQTTPPPHPPPQYLKVSCDSTDPARGLAGRAGSAPRGGHMAAAGGRWGRGVTPRFQRQGDQRHQDDR